MSSPAIENKASTLPVDKHMDEPLLGRRLFALALMVVGAASLAVNLGLITPEVQPLLASLWPAGVIVIGLGLLLLGNQVWMADASPFDIPREEAADADLLVSAGTADLQLGSTSEPAQLASGELPLPKRPKLERHDHHARVRIEPLWRLPSLSRAHWSVRLAHDLPWQISVGSSTGNLDLDLIDLAPAGVRVRSLFGDVDLRLPAAGGADLDLHLIFGDLTINVPADLGVKVVLQAGALADVEHDERRFIQLGEHEIGTPLYAVAARRCTLAVWLGTGHLRLK